MAQNLALRAFSNIIISPSKAINDASTMSLLSSPPSNGSSKGRERSKKLVEAVLQSRKFVIVYQPIILLIIICFAIRRYVRYCRSKQRRRTIEKGTTVNNIGVQNYEDSASSNLPSSTESSSLSGRTLDGNSTPPRKHGEDTSLPGEERPLLGRRSRAVPRGTISSSIDGIKGAMMYQPPPIPIIGKSLPSNAMTMFIFTLFGLNLFFLLYQVPFTIDMIFIFADRAGLVFAINLPCLYLIAAKNQPTKLLTGHSYEALNIIHRRLGEWLCLLAVLHVGGMMIVWYTVLRPESITLGHFLVIPLVILGIGAFVSYELLYFTSLRSFRQRWYELFLASHITLQIAALVFLYFHHSGSRPYVIASLVVFAVDRLYFRLYSSTITTTATVTTTADSSTVIVHAKIPQAKHTTLLFIDSSLHHSWYPGSHVFITVPALSPAHIFQAHPFSIFSPPPPSPSAFSASESNGPTSTLTLLIRAHDGFSSDLLRDAQQKAALASANILKVRLDGPYGSHSAFHMLQASDITILIAGGSGVAVTWPMVRCLYSSDIEFTDPETALQRAVKRNIFFVWVVRSAEHYKWLDRDQLSDLAGKRGVTVAMPPPTEKAGERPDVRETMRTWLEGLGERFSAKSKIGVVVSGPDGMTRNVRNGCAELVGQGYDVEVEVKKFGW